MSNKFERYANRLQQKITKEDIKDYNEKIVNLFYNPENWGKPSYKNITAFAEGRGGPKNYFLGLYLRILNNIIIEAYFVTDGCGVMVATGSQLTILIKNKPLDFAEILKAEDIDKELMGLPEEEKYCPHLAIEILKDLIKNYKQNVLS